MTQGIKAQTKPGICPPLCSGRVVHTQPLSQWLWRQAGTATHKQPLSQNWGRIPIRPQVKGSDPNSGGVTEAAWPNADVVVGNPPFLGGSKKRRELGDTYFAGLDRVFAGRTRRCRPGVLLV